MTEEETAPQQPDPAAGSGGPEAAMAPEISRRVGSILDAVEREASRLRDEAQAEAARYSDNARRHADDLVSERQRRIAELSDELIAKSEAVVARLDDAAPVRQGFENLVRALGDAAERLSHESEATSDDFAPPSFHEGARQMSPESQPQGPPTYEAPTQDPPAPTVPAQGQVPAAPPLPQGPPPASPPIPPTYGQQPHPARAPSPPAWQPPTQEPVPPPPAQSPPAPGARNATWRELDDARMVAIQMASAGSTRGDVHGHLNLALGIPDPTSTLDEIFGPGTGEDARVPWTTGQR